MDREYLVNLYKWYYQPGEVLRGIGFYINPYKQFEHSKFRHIFAFDSKFNLYVGQYSVYPEHIEKFFDLEEKREYGYLYPTNPPVARFDSIETYDIALFNRRLKPMVQRFYDYGMPPDTIIHSTKVDLLYPTIEVILKGNYIERPDYTELVEKLT